MKKAPTSHLALGAAALATVAWSETAHAWLFVEHTNIGRTALSLDCGVPDSLSAEQRKALDAAWLAVRLGGDMGDLNQAISAPTEAIGEGPLPFDLHVDFPMLVALAGDHSCDAADLTATARSTWLRALVSDFAKNYEDIQVDAFTSVDRTSAWHLGDLQAQRDDDKYLSRAAQNGAHFVLARASVPVMESLADYVRRVSQVGAPINAVGIYVAYHARAMKDAATAGCHQAPCHDPDRARSALLHEAVALHFLEDAFASGHVAGIPADTSSASRKGTHDEYCEYGLSTTTWAGDAYPAFGDAHMHCEDRRRAAQAVRRSLSALAAVLKGDSADDCDVGKVSGALPSLCTSPYISGAPQSCEERMQETLRLLPSPPFEVTPVPSRRNDVGAFIRFAAGAYLGAGVTSATQSGEPAPLGGVPTWGLEGAVGAGFSVAGITTASSDATAFLQVGLDAAAGQRTEWCFVCNDASSEPVETRIGIAFRARLPFWMIPGDFLVIAPLAAVWKPAFNALVRSAEGGLLVRAERVHNVSENMAWQLILGREVEFSSYSFPSPTNHVNSWAITAPVVELAWRGFSETLASHVKVQLGYRGEHSPFVTAHFLVVSFDADSNMYFSGF